MAAKQPLTRAGLVLAGAAGVVGGALLTLLLLPSLRPGAEPGPTAPPPPARALGPVAPASYAGAVALAAPSVVNIFTSKVTTERQPLEFKDPILQHYYGRLLPEQTRRHMETSLGSGVVVHPAGYALTNLHILEGADEIKVVLADGSNAEVGLVGKDPDTDLAVLKLESGPAIQIGDARKLQVGDVALAIGNPYGVGQSVTMGIVGATGRSHLGISTFENFIQTDAAINPGNSGGALINARGELIGINTAIFSNSGGSHGVGFAIPVNLAMSVLDQLLRTGRVVRGWIGITGQDVTAAAKASFALKTAEGVLVSGVLEDGPAERAGLRAGDVITHVDNRRLNDIQDLLDMIASAGPGRKLLVSGWRGSQRFELPTVTSERPATQ
jgi:Do/DeqQ family serine protease